jgi:hypothetical protein
MDCGETGSKTPPPEGKVMPVMRIHGSLPGRDPTMKKLVVFAAVFVFILLLTKIANQVPPPAPSGTAFSLMAQHVVQCSPDEITLVDGHDKSTHLEKDSSWPDCSVFKKDDVLDFYLSRGEKTRFLSFEKTAWWRKSI